jgi:hypothetical protein
MPMNDALAAEHHQRRTRRASPRLGGRITEERRKQGKDENGRKTRHHSLAKIYSYE